MKSILKTIDLSEPTPKLVNSFLKPYYEGTKVEPIIVHEVKALEILSEYDIAPVVKSYGKDFIEMSYVGKDIGTNKISLAEINRIVSILKEVNIIHNDLAFGGKIRNCTYYKNKLYLIDFQLASIDGVPPVEAIHEAFWRTDYVSDEKQLREMLL